MRNIADYSCDGSSQHGEPRIGRCLRRGSNHAVPTFQLDKVMMIKSEKQKMLDGELYDAEDSEIQSDQAAAREWMVRFNAASGVDRSQRRTLLEERLAQVGDGSTIRPPFHCDYGTNIWLGAGVFLNFGCVILDVVSVTIGDGTQIGPNVQILTADHPRDSRQRALGLEFGRPIQIGRNVWIGGGAILLPGVRVGDGAVIGAGSVVTRDVPAEVTVSGNPARDRRQRRRFSPGA